jgi:predicted O-linked N-acetylglucosamine transferase (SPINDLY family)
VSDRVRILPRRSRADFLGLLRTADALLDPLPFGGGTTSYAALGMGLPIVTWPGSLMRGRATYACYRQLGVTDCIAESAETYVELAVRLANDREFRADVGRGISEASPGLFEDVAVVQEIEEFLVGARAAV